MSFNRRHLFRLAAVSTLIAATLPAWAGEGANESGDLWLRAGKVFTSTNAATQNELLVFDQSEGGALNLIARLATGGQGTGAGLGSQGAVTLSQDGRHVFVVNAQSHSVSTFALRGRELNLVSTVASGGLGPISVTEHEGLVYVLNAQGGGNIAGFRNERGTLKPLEGAQGPLSVVTGAAPAQISFTSEGDALVVSEKGTNKLTSYRVRRDGKVSAPLVASSAGVTPFGFAVDRRDHLIVSEAAGGAPGASTVSSYKFGESDPARPVLVSAAVPSGQTAACWVAVTPNGKFAYVANTGSGNVSSYAVSPRTGQISLLQAAAGSLGAGSTPTDVAVSADGRHLYALGAGSLAITSFEVRSDGSLLTVGRGAGLPRGTVGLAAN